MLVILRRVCYTVENLHTKGLKQRMEPKDYSVIRIEGEYAYLRADGASEQEDLFIAMALLPPDIDVGTRLHYEMFCYSIID